MRFASQRSITKPAPLRDREAGSRVRNCPMSASFGPIPRPFVLHPRPRRRHLDKLCDFPGFRGLSDGGVAEQVGFWPCGISRGNAKVCRLTLQSTAPQDLKARRDLFHREDTVRNSREAAHLVTIERWGRRVYRRRSRSQDLWSEPRVFERMASQESSS